MQTGKTNSADTNEADQLEFSDTFGCSSVRKHLQVQEFFRRRALDGGKWWPHRSRVDLRGFDKTFRSIPRFELDVLEVVSKVSLAWLLAPDFVEKSEVGTILGRESDF